MNALNLTFLDFLSISVVLGIFVFLILIFVQQQILKNVLANPNYVAILESDHAVLKVPFRCYDNRRTRPVLHHYFCITARKTIPRPLSEYFTEETGIVHYINDIDINYIYNHEDLTNIEFNVKETKDATT